jgi:hypothetical protein
VAYWEIKGGIYKKTAIDAKVLDQFFNFINNCLRRSYSTNISTLDSFGAENAIEATASL